MDTQTKNSEETAQKTYQKPELINLSLNQPQNDIGDGADAGGRSTIS